jgi:hypothetical protein
METILFIALVAAVAGLITSMVILYNLLFVKKNRLLHYENWSLL